MPIHWILEGSTIAKSGKQRGATMKKFISAMLLMSLLAACAPAATPVPVSDDKLAEILARGTLVIATDEAYAPQSKLIENSTPAADTKCAPTQYTANQFTGFDVEVAVAIAGELGVEPCFVTPPWSQLIAGSWQNNWDVHVGSVAITFDRMKSLYFSQPYYATPTVALVHVDNTSINELEDLSGKRIGVCAGCVIESYLKMDLKMPGQEFQYRIQNAEIVAYENEEPALDDLAKGDGAILDSVLTLLPVARSAIKSGRPFRMLDEPVIFAYASVTLDRINSRNPERLLAEITRIVKKLHSDGRLKDLSMKYIGIDMTQKAAAFDLSKIDQNP
jgi:polar amino acid transport system substrate-binding protein